MAVLGVLLGSVGAQGGRTDPSGGACEFGTLRSYIQKGSTGCTAGGLDYFNFAFTSTAEPPLSWFNDPPTHPDTLIATRDNIFVTPPQAHGDQIAFDSQYFQVGEGDRIVYYWTYTIDPPPDILPGFDLEMDAFSPVAPGYATIDAVVCAGGNLNLFSLFLPPLSCKPAKDPAPSSFRKEPYRLRVEYLAQPDVIQLTDTVTFDVPTNYIQVWLRLELNGGPKGGGGSSQINGFRTSVTPEPGTWAMLGAGLSGLALFRRRRAKTS